MLICSAMTQAVGFPAPHGGALKGVQVIEWGSGRASAYAGRLLSGLGARVVLVERNEARRERAFPADPIASRPRQVAALTRFLHGGKLSVELDPGSEQGRDDLLSLCRSADIVLVDHPIAALEAIDLGPETVAAASEIASAMRRADAEWAKARGVLLPQRGGEAGA